MKKILFIKRKSITGGEAYENMLVETLRKKYYVDLFEIDTQNTLDAKKSFFRLVSRLLPRLRCLLQVNSKLRDYDLVIEDFFVKALSFRRAKKRIVIVHHFDNTFLLHQKLYNLLEKIFWFRMRHSPDVIVAVSDFWKKIFQAKGVKNIKVIYNSFDTINVSKEEIKKFKKKFDLEGKSIVYIGNCQEIKGVVESYKALAHLNVHLVTSGKQRIDLPAKNLDLTKAEYYTLLAASSIVITMSKFNEGWCRTAHEAMLLGKPVIGSGRGGMQELLHAGHQTVCSSFDDLESLTSRLLNNRLLRKKQGLAGFKYASKFTKEMFQKEWFKLIEDLT
jgi:glycosyltransferase involved in cell wall biosynthesis